LLNLVCFVTLNAVGAEIGNEKTNGRNNLQGKSGSCAKNISDMHFRVEKEIKSITVHIGDIIMWYIY